MKQLLQLLSMGSLNGTVAIASAAGMITLANAPAIAFLFLAGPGALLSATLLPGTLQDRALAAFAAGLLSTLLVVAAAAFGPLALNFLNLTALKIAGGLALFAIGLMFIGVSVPEQLPSVIMLGGLILALALRWIPKFL